ncbi:hypothetical protein F5879DRAFT_972597 [Lentinula edodes]|nr:hypothetical protein F5879DRAFT_972597 [Lentinula edodes]
MLCVGTNVIPILYLSLAMVSWYSISCSSQCNYTFLELTIKFRMFTSSQRSMNCHKVAEAEGLNGTAERSD